MFDLFLWLIRYCKKSFHSHWKCNFLRHHHVRLMVGLLVGWLVRCWSVCHDVMQGGKLHLHPYIEELVSDGYYEINYQSTLREAFNFGLRPC